MRRRIRIIHKTRKPTFTEQLESHARRIVRRTRETESASPIRAVVDSELALVVDHIDRERGLQEQLRRNLLRLECYIDTEIMQRSRRVAGYLGADFPERDMLRARLLRIEEERRRLARQHEDKIRGLHERLLEAVNKRRQFLL